MKCFLFSISLPLTPNHTPGSLFCLQALWGSLMCAWLTVKCTPALQRTQQATCPWATICTFKVSPWGLFRKLNFLETLKLKTSPLTCVKYVRYVNKWVCNRRCEICILREMCFCPQLNPEFSPHLPSWKPCLAKRWLSHVWSKENQAPRSAGFTMDFLLEPRTLHPSGLRGSALMTRAPISVWPRTAPDRRPWRSSWKFLVNIPSIPACSICE